ncbi:MAG: hypothetical protein MJ247_00400 [Alphaproteobacteria bacterium]|nr:hypothetical protein [Alphaproteobacteria bacterium]
MSKTEKNEKVLEVKRPLVKFAKIISIVWGLFVAIPLLSYVNKNSVSLQQYGTVFAVKEANSFLLGQYDGFAKKAMAKIDLKKYTDKIDIPEIKIDAKLNKLQEIDLSKITSATKTADKASKALSKLGVKNANVADAGIQALQKQAEQINSQLKNATSEVEKQIKSISDKANTQIKDATTKVKTSLVNDVENGLKSEISSFAGNQIQKQLELDDELYNNLTSGNFKIKGSNTSKIYSSLRQKGIFAEYIQKMEKYVGTAKNICLSILLVLLAVPPLVFFIVARILSSSHGQCPYCGKEIKFA